MAEIKRVWMVTDPGEKSVLQDFVWDQNVANIQLQFAGESPGWWRRVNGKMHTDRASALTDARTRLKKIRPGDVAEMFKPANVKRALG